MTDNTTQTVVHYVDPRTLQPSKRNTRADLGDLSELAASIAASGVLEPLLVARNDDGQTIILAGHRRTAAAIEAGAETVPVIYRDGDTADVDQLSVILAENTHRRDLTDSETISAVQQMIELGESGASISRLTGINKKRTTRLARIARSTDEVREAITTHSLTLDQALALDEFKDQPETVADLLDVIETGYGPGEFDSRVRRYRVAKKIAGDLAASLATYAEDGVTAYAEDDEQRPDSVRLTEIYGWEQTQAERIDAHGDCPHRIVVLSGNVWRETIDHEERCADPEKHPAYVEAQQERAERMTRYGQAEAQATDPETKKAERRRVIANNKAMDAATAHRLAWLAQLLATKRPALGKNPATLLARLYAERGRKIGDPGLHTEGALETVGWKHGQPSERAQAATAHGYLFALIAAATEASTTRSAWRDRWSADEHAAWLRVLVTLGYEPTGIEQAMIDGTVTTYTDEG